MSDQISKEIRSKVTSDGNIEISIATTDKPVPTDDQVLIEVQASPINPSDLGLLLSFAADLETINVSGSGDDTVATMKIHPALMGAMKPRLDESMPVGNEGAGVIVDAGANAKDLIGSCQTLPQFLKETKKIAPNFMMNSPSSTAALTEELQEGWNEFWENKNA